MKLLIVWAIGIALLAIASGFRKKAPVASAPRVHEASADKTATPNQRANNRPAA
jgi:hypothetical protein